MGVLSLILYRKPDGAFGLWACRGAGKGCKRNSYRKDVSRKPCEDCVGPLPENLTLEQVQERLSRGDA